MEHNKRLFYIQKSFEYVKKIKNYKKMLFLITIFSVFLGSSNFLFSFMLQKTLSSAIARDYYQLGFVSILFLIASAIYGVAFYYMQKYKEIINQELNLLLKSELLEQIIKIPLSQKNKFGQGNLLIMLNEDSENFATYFSNIIIPSFQLIMSMVSGSVYILLYSWQIFLLISLITVLFVIFNGILLKKMNISFMNLQKIKDSQRTFWEDIHISSDISKIFNLRSFNMFKSNALFSRRFQAEKKYANDTGLSSSLIEGTILSIELLMLVVGIILVKYSVLSVPVLIGIWNASIGTLIYPFMDFPEIMKKKSQAISSFNRIRTVFSYERENIKGSFIEINEPSLHLRDTDFSYNSDIKILKNINLTVKKGELILIEGESGAGKSTLIDLLLHLIYPDNGRIFFTNADNEIIKCNPRAQISYVPQGKFVLNTSTEENLKMSETEDRSLSEKTILDFIQKAGLPLDSINNNVGKIKLSHGQLQRLALVRALLKEANFIVMDEPFSALDNENIERVTNLINNAKKHCGIIIVSHRVAKGLHVDRSYQLKGGNLNEI